MIEVTKLGGERFFVNADHIESVEAQPDTSLILNNGKRIIVREAVPEVVRKVFEYQKLIRFGIPALTLHRNELENLGETLLLAKAD